MAPSTYVEILAAIALTSFFPLITISFFKFRLVQKQEQLEMLESRIDFLGKNEGRRFKDQIDKEFPSADYILPLIFVSAIVFIGMFLALLGWIMFDEEATGDQIRTVLWSGSLFWESQPEILEEKRNISVVAYAILGSYISAAQYIYRRYATIDLTPGNFYSISIRMVLSASVALMLSHLLASDADSLLGGEVLLAVAFLTGIFPDKGFKLLLDKVKIFPKADKEDAKNFSLESIEGLSQMHRIRLEELGIDNVQNLAQYDFLLLIIKTPFPMRILLDWVAQSKLIMEFQEDFYKLDKAGIRTILDFWDACQQSENRIDEIAEVSGVNSLSLHINFQNISKDNSVAVLKRFREHADHVYLKME
ncbi:MAG: hypothetical protein JXR03_02135 [Cyclobacteriaceae bacterium]